MDIDPRDVVDFALDFLQSNLDDPDVHDALAERLGFRLNDEGISPYSMSKQIRAAVKKAILESGGK